MDTKDLRLAVAKAVAHTDANIRDKLLKRARKHGLTDHEMVALAEAWKQAAKKTKYLKVARRASKRPNNGTIPPR